VILLTGKWPHFPDIVNATDHDIRDHPWFQLGKPQKKVDKGKRRAVEPSGNNAVAGPSGVKETEVQGSRGQVTPCTYLGRLTRPPEGENRPSVTGQRMVAQE